MNIKGKTLLVIAPHPDDEVIGCAGLIQRIKEEGGKVFVMFLTVGKTKDFSKQGKSTTKEREKEIKKVATFLKFDGYQVIFKGSRYHLKLDTLGQMELMQIVERDSKVAIEKIKPDIVAFPSLYSYNQDHKLAAYSIHASLRPAENTGKHFVPYVLAYESPADSWSIHTQNIPNFFLPLTLKHVEGKIKAMEMYKSQARPYPNLRSSEMLMSLARLRGGLISSPFAEGYIMYRGILT